MTAPTLTDAECQAIVEQAWKLVDNKLAFNEALMRVAFAAGQRATVPREPTEAMMLSGMAMQDAEDVGQDTAGIWRAMYDAAPHEPAQDRQEARCHECGSVVMRPHEPAQSLADRQTTLGPEIDAALASIPRSELYEPQYKPIAYLGCIVPGCREPAQVPDSEYCKEHGQRAEVASATAAEAPPSSEIGAASAHPQPQRDAGQDDLVHRLLRPNLWAGEAIMLAPKAAARIATLERELTGIREARTFQRVRAEAAERELANIHRAMDMERELKAQSKLRAEAAERKVAELERALKAVADASPAWTKLGVDHLQNIARAAIDAAIAGTPDK